MGLEFRIRETRLKEVPNKVALRVTRELYEEALRILEADAAKGGKVLEPNADTVAYAKTVEGWNK